MPANTSASSILVAMATAAIVPSARGMPSQEARARSPTCATRRRTLASASVPGATAGLWLTRSSAASLPQSRRHKSTWRL
eukprot:4519743-Alexandrium_andersonii.AAC.1